MKYKVRILESITECREYEFETNSQAKAAKMARIHFVDRGINPGITDVTINVNERVFEVAPESLKDFKEAAICVKVYGDGEVKEMPEFSKYDWLITRGIFEQSLFGIQGPEFGGLSARQIKKHKKGKRFRVLDDDDEVYYEGITVEHDNSCTGFEPLEDYGSPSLGATAIEYWENGSWVRL